MKLEINAEIDASEIVADYFIPKITKMGYPTITTEAVRVMVQNKAGEYVDVDPTKVKLVWKN